LKLLFDECMHTSLLQVAHDSGHQADHVTYLGLGSSKDWELMAFVLEHDYIFVTNNHFDFLALYGKASLHAGLIVLVPNVVPARQRELLKAALEHVGTRQLVNSVVEVRFLDQQTECLEYGFPKSR
jgi:predicted nuclease of predicted toxin-antitoxin system